MITMIDVSQEIFAMDILTALKSSLKRQRKHVLRLLQLCGDQASCFTGSSLDTNSITFFVLQSPIIADV